MPCMKKYPCVHSHKYFQNRRGKSHIRDKYQYGIINACTNLKAYKMFMKVKSFCAEYSQ